MSILVIILRLVHVVGGIIWVGGSVFASVFVGPALQEAGPDGAKVGAAMVRRGMMTFMPLVATATIISGLWLYWRDSGGFSAVYLATPIGMTFGLGGALALVMFVLGITIAMPAMRRAAALQQSLASLPESDRPAPMAEIGRLQARAGALARWAPRVLLVAAAAMGIARYV